MPEPSDPTARAGTPAWLRWVEAAQAGDSAAFARLHRDFAAMVHGLLLARVDPSSADDLTQDVFLGAWQRLAELREPIAWPRWLAAIARRRAIDHQRSIGKRPGTLPPELGDHEDATGDRARVRSEAERLLAIIRTLPEPYVEPLLLRLVEGLSGPEIAERCDLSPGYVRVNLHRGMKLLRERLEHER
ncbi:RNA polymerase sigma factor [Nannocystaceae bacterium ST9]